MFHEIESGSPYERLFCTVRNSKDKRFIRRLPLGFPGELSRVRGTQSQSVDKALGVMVED